MSEWEVRFIVAGAVSESGGAFSRESLAHLSGLLPGVPLCRHLRDGVPNHPAQLAAWLPRVGVVLAARLIGRAIFGIVRIEDPAVHAMLRQAERWGRGVETEGLSLRGKVIQVPAGHTAPECWMTKVISLDIIRHPLGGGGFLRSAEAEAAGWPDPDRFPFEPLAQRWDQTAAELARRREIRAMVESDEDMMPFEGVRP